MLVLGALGAVIAAPSLAPGAGSGGAVTSGAPRVTAAGSVGPAERAVIRHGMVGGAAGVNPLTAATRTEREFAALVFAGLVRLGPDQSYEPGLASRWTVSQDGATWTFHIRDDARWHDGTPVTARDVVFTVALLRDPAYDGPTATSWRDVTASAVGERTVRFTLGTPIAGFLDAARQPLLPSHLLAGVRVAELGTHPFNRRPVGAGPYRLVALDEETALLEPASAEPAATPSPALSPGAPGPGLTPPRAAPPVPPDVAVDLELRFYPDAASLADAWESGDVDVASGLPPAEAAALAAGTNGRLIRYPTTTLTAVLLNVRPNRPEVRVAATRRALLQVIDRRAMIEGAWTGFASMADAPISPTSWAFDQAASPHVAHDPASAAQALGNAGWRKAGTRWVPPGRTAPWSIEIFSADASSSASSHAAAAAVAGDLARFGIAARHVALDPAALVTERLRPGHFVAAVVDVNIGLDPDLYPLLASSQTRSSGLNLGGVVDAELDRLLVAARTPGPEAGRRAAYRALQERLASQQYVLPLAFREEVVVVRDTVFGITPRLIADPGDRYWDVLAWRLAAGR